MDQILTFSESYDEVFSIKVTQEEEEYAWRKQ